MTCWCQGNKRAMSIEKVRDIARKAAKMDGSVYVLFEKAQGEFWFVKDEEKYTGKLIEYVYP